MRTLRSQTHLDAKRGSETYENGLGFIRHFQHFFYVSENEMIVEIFLCDTFFLFMFVCLLETSPRSFECITNFFNNYD